MKQSNKSNQLILFCAKKEEFKKFINELSTEGFTVYLASTMAEVINRIQQTDAEVLLLDSSENKAACLELCYMIRLHEKENKVIIITSDLYDERREIEAFRSGADDYLIKPLSAAAFTERIKRRLKAPTDIITVQQNPSSSSRIRIDRESYSVFVGNDSVNVSRKEFELLYLLASKPGRIFSKAELAEKVWGRKMEEDERSIDVHVLRLRKKFGKDVIYTQKGIGYKFVKEEDKPHAEAEKSQVSHSNGYHTAPQVKETEPLEYILN